MNYNETQKEAIYRYMNLCELGSLLRGKLSLTRLDYWQHSDPLDPLENFISQGESPLTDGNSASWGEFAKKVYAICFTTNSEDAWNIFDKERTGLVRVECNYAYLQNLCCKIKKEFLQLYEKAQQKPPIAVHEDEPWSLKQIKLFVNSCMKNIQDSTHESTSGDAEEPRICALKKVRYATKESIIQYRETIHQYIIKAQRSIEPKILLDTWFIKDKKFEKQQEIRLVTDWQFDDHTVTLYHDRNVLEFDIDPMALIRSIKSPPLCKKVERELYTLVEGVLGRDCASKLL